MLAVIVDGRAQWATAGSRGRTASVVLAATPFYAEMGGEVGDTGIIENGEGTHLQVLDTKAPEKGLFVHAVRGRASTGLAEGDSSRGAAWTRTAAPRIRAQPHRHPHPARRAAPACSATT